MASMQRSEAILMFWEETELELQTETDVRTREGGDVTAQWSGVIRLSTDFNSYHILNHMVNSAAKNVYHKFTICFFKMCITQVLVQKYPFSNLLNRM